MKYTTLTDISYDEKKDWLKITDFENMFHIYDDGKNNFYNLNSTLYLNIPDEYLSEYICTHPMAWTTISYKLYLTTRLAWFLMKLNNVKATDVFKLKQPGDKIKYLNTEQVNSIVEQLNEEQ